MSVREAADKMTTLKIQDQAWFSVREGGNPKHTGKQRRKSLSFSRLDGEAHGQEKLCTLWKALHYYSYE